MNIVSNSTPLIALAKMEALPLLRSLFKTVFVPTEVFREVARYGRGRPGAEEIIRASWIVNQKVRAKSWVKRIAERENLGRGEAETPRPRASDHDSAHRRSESRRCRFEVGTEGFEHT